jgi:hypothetical protein
MVKIYYQNMKLMICSLLTINELNGHFVKIDNRSERLGLIYFRIYFKYMEKLGTEITLFSSTSNLV